MICKSISRLHHFEHIKALLGSEILLNTPKPKGLSISIDDGPNPYAHAMIKLFKRENISASFFVLATKVQQNPEIARCLLEENHELCVHGYDHTIITDMTPDAFQRSLHRFDDVMREHNLPYKKIYRPPNGEIAPEYVEVLKTEGFQTVLWSLDSFDWEFNSKQIQAHFEQQRDLHQLTLFHDGVIGGSPFSTLKSLVALIRLCKKKQIPIVPMNLG